MDRLTGSRATQASDSATHRATARPDRYAVVASRWGRRVERRKASFQMLQYAAISALRDSAHLLVAHQTSAQPWVERTAELFRVPVEHLAIDGSEQRDTQLIDAADKLFAVWVRRGGTIAALLRDKINRTAPGHVWVAVTGDPDCAGRELVAEGAVGWYAAAANKLTNTDASLPLTANTHSAEPAQGDALVGRVDWRGYFTHCTRERCGAFPGQSPDAWRDEVILGGEAGRPAGPLEVLAQILRLGWLRGSDRVTQRGEPVTCWSAVPLPELLAHRTFRSHLGRWDYEPYGLAVTRSALIRAGAEPVIYGPHSLRSQLPPEQRWRFQAEGKSGQWKAEHEWRLRGSLSLDKIADNEAIVFVEHEQDAAAIAPWSRWPVEVVRLSV